jgi:hypothetical protein
VCCVLCVVRAPCWLDNVAAHVAESPRHADSATARDGAPPAPQDVCLGPGQPLGTLGVRRLRQRERVGVGAVHHALALVASLNPFL